MSLLRSVVRDAGRINQTNSPKASGTNVPGQNEANASQVSFPSEGSDRSAAVAQGSPGSTSSNFDSRAVEISEGKSHLTGQVTDSDVETNRSSAAGQLHSTPLHTTPLNTTPLQCEPIGASPETSIDKTDQPPTTSGIAGRSPVDPEHFLVASAETSSSPGAVDKSHDPLVMADASTERTEPSGLDRPDLLLSNPAQSPSTESEVKRSSVADEAIHSTVPQAKESAAASEPAAKRHATPRENYQRCNDTQPGDSRHSTEQGSPVVSPLESSKDDVDRGQQHVSRHSSVHARQAKTSDEPRVETQTRSVAPTQREAQLSHAQHSTEATSSHEPSKKDSNQTERQAAKAERTEFNPLPGGSRAAMLSESRKNTPLVSAVVQARTSKVLPDKSKPPTVATAAFARAMARAETPKVQIGKIDITIEAPARTASRPAATSSPIDFASRHFLRRL